MLWVRWKNIINHPYLYTSHYRTWCWDNTKKLWSNLDSFYIYSRCQKFMYTYHGCDYPGNSGLLIIYLNFIYFWWNYCTPHFLKEVVSKISPPDVSKFETAVNWILFSYHFQFKCINLSTVDTVGQITPRLFTLEEVLKLVNWVNESVTLTSIQWQWYWGEVLRISWTPLLVRTAVFARETNWINCDMMRECNQTVYQGESVIFRTLKPHSI